MTISRAADDAVTAFVRSLPDYVEAPVREDFGSTAGGCVARWGGIGLICFGADGEPQHEPGFLKEIGHRLIEHYKPKPREIVGWMIDTSLNPGKGSKQCWVWIGEEPSALMPWTTTRVRIVEEPKPRG